MITVPNRRREIRWIKTEYHTVDPVIYTMSQEEQLAWQKQHRKEQLRLCQYLLRNGGLLSYLINQLRLELYDRTGIGMIAP